MNKFCKKIMKYWDKIFQIKKIYLKIFENIFLMYLVIFYCFYLNLIQLSKRINKMSSFLLG